MLPFPFPILAVALSFVSSSNSYSYDGSNQEARAAESVQFSSVESPSFVSNPVIKSSGMRPSPKSGYGLPVPPAVLPVIPSPAYPAVPSQIPPLPSAYSSYYSSPYGSPYGYKYNRYSLLPYTAPAAYGYSPASLNNVGYGVSFLPGYGYNSRYNSPLVSRSIYSGYGLPATSDFGFATEIAPLFRSGVTPTSRYSTLPLIAGNPSPMLAPVVSASPYKTSMLAAPTAQGKGSALRYGYTIPATA